MIRGNGPPGRGSVFVARDATPGTEKDTPGNETEATRKRVMHNVITRGNRPGQGAQCL